MDYLNNMTASATSRPIQVAYPGDTSQTIWLSGPTSDTSKTVVIQAGLPPCAGCGQPLKGWWYLEFNSLTGARYYCADCRPVAFYHDLMDIYERCKRVIDDYQQIRDVYDRVKADR